MPCRYFEPLQVIAPPFHPNARLPLIDEYDGRCHAGAELAGILAESRFAGCNHGNRDNACDRFPQEHDRTVFRFTVAKHNQDELEILAVEDTNHRPTRWQTVRFTLASEQLTPDLSDVCTRAQVVAFCRSYLRKACAASYQDPG